MSKVIKKSLTWMLMLVMIVSGAVTVSQISAQKAEAATTKCYSFPEGKKVKIGKYYYKVNSKGNLQRSKSKNKNFKTIVSSSNANYLSTGKLIYYVDCSVSTQGKEKSTVYSCDMNGKSKKKVFTIKKSITLDTIHNTTLYVSQGSEWSGYVTYSYSLKGKAKLKKVIKELRLFNEQKGQYILGAEWMPTDVSSYGICIYDAKKNKKISLGAGLAACFIDNKVYYASYDEKANCYYIKRCNPNGSKKEVLATLDNTIWYVTNITKTYCEGYSTSGDGMDIVKINY